MNRMTLLEYIECQNIKRKIKSKTKSKNKQAARQRQTSPLISNIQQVNLGKQIKQTKLQSKSSVLQLNSKQKSSVLQLDSKLSVLSQSIQIDSFVVMNQKIQEIKEFVRQKIQDDKCFAIVSKMLNELQQILRLQIMKTYRLQLYKFQFQNQKAMNQQMKIILSELNNRYLESQIKYKQSLQKGKTELSQKQKQMIISIHDLVQQKGQKNTGIKQTNSISQSIYMGSPTTKQKGFDLPETKIQINKKLSFIESLIAKGQQISKNQKQVSKESAQTQKKQVKIVIKSQQQKQKTKKVKWTDSKQVINQQYPLPSFINNISEREQLINKNDQSQIQIKQQLSRREQHSNGKQSLGNNMPDQILKIIHSERESSQSQNQFTQKYLNKINQKKNQLKQTIKQSKDYLKLERSPTQKNQKSKPKNKG